EEERRVVGDDGVFHLAAVGDVHAAAPTDDRAVAGNGHVEEVDVRRMDAAASATRPVLADRDIGGVQRPIIDEDGASVAACVVGVERAAGHRQGTLVDVDGPTLRERGVEIQFGGVDAGRAVQGQRTATRNQGAEAGVVGEPAGGNRQDAAGPA